MLLRKVFKLIIISNKLSSESKRLENQTKLDKLNIRHREMIQELKDKEFQLECIQQLLTNSICNEVSTGISLKTGFILVGFKRQQTRT